MKNDKSRLISKWLRFNEKVIRFNITEFDNYTGIRRASVELLARMGVTLTNTAKQELTAAAPENYVNAQTALDRGSIDYTRETTSFSFKMNFHAFPQWFDLVPRAVLQDVRNGLNATRKANEWWLGSWPSRTVTGLNPFNGRSKDFAVVFELVNDKGKVIGTQSLRLRGSWGFSFSSGGASLSYDENNFQTVTFNGVNANDISDTLTIRVASVNGADPETVTRSGSLQITALGTFPTSYEFSKGVITRYTADWRSEVVIPDTIWGEPVKAIGKSAFEGKEHTDYLRNSGEYTWITSVTIPNGVTSIGERAFANNDITSITIPSSVKSIGYQAFAGNGLTRVTIPDGVTSYGEGAFAGSYASAYEFSKGVITKYNGYSGDVFIPPYLPYTRWHDPVEAIGERAFEGMKIRSITIPNSVRTIGDYALSAKYLESITIGANVSLGKGVTYQGLYSNGSTSFTELYNRNGKNAGTYYADFRNDWSLK